MARYVYEGRAPADDGDGGLLRPLDEREFDADPGPPWRLLDEPEAAEKPSEAPESPPGPKVALPAATAAVSSTAPPKPGTTED